MVVKGRLAAIGEPVVFESIPANIQAAVTGMVVEHFDAVVTGLVFATAEVVTAPVAVTVAALIALGIANFAAVVVAVATDENGNETEVAAGGRENAIVAQDEPLIAAFAAGR